MGMISDGVLQLAVNSSMLLRKLVFFSVFLLLIMRIGIKTSLLKCSGLGQYARNVFKTNVRYKVSSHRIEISPLFAHASVIGLVLLNHYHHKKVK